MQLAVKEIKFNWKSHLILCLIAFKATVSGQNLDSLKQASFNQEGKQLVETYIIIGEVYVNKFGSVDSLLYYSTKAYNYAIQINDQAGALKSLSNIGLAYAKDNDIVTSSKIWSKLLQQDLLKDPTFIGNLHMRLGLNANFENNDDKSMEHFIEAAKCFEEVKDYDGLALAYCRMAYIFSTQKQFDKVKDYCRQAINLIPKTQNKFTQVSVYSSVTGLYIQIGTEQPAYVDSAIHYGTAALSIALENEYYNKGSQLCNSISAAYNIKGNNDKALEYLKFATRFNQYLYKGEAIITYLNLSDAYAGLKQYGPCLQYLDSSAVIAKDLNDLYYYMAVAERVYVYNKEAGNSSEALIGLEQFKLFEDSLFTNEKITNINDINAKYETELKDAQIKNLNQSKKLDEFKIIVLIIGIVITLLSTVLILIIFRQRSLSQKHKINEAELRLSRSRINPHFFFNAIAALQSEALNEKDNTKMSLYLSKFAKIMRLTLEGSYTNMVTIERELDFVTKYMDVQKFRFENKFDYELNIEDSSITSLLKVPSMILQPFIENSIEHGFANIKYQGKIIISVSEKSDHLEIIIDDNGMGDSSERHLKEFPSRATSIINDRLFLLSKKIKKPAGFEMSKKQNENGFIVKLHLPLIES